MIDQIKEEKLMKKAKMSWYKYSQHDIETPKICYKRPPTPIESLGEKNRIVFIDSLVPG